MVDRPADRRSWWQRWTRRIAALLLMLVALGLASWMNSTQGGTDAFHRLAPEIRNEPFDVVGTPGHPVQTRQFRLTVEATAGATKVTVDDPFGKRTVDSGSVFVVVTAVVESGTETAQISRYVLRDSRGREFQATKRWSQECVGAKFEPRMPTRVWPVFEVATDASGLQLEVSTALDERLDAQAVVPLGVTDDQLSRWAKNATPVTVGQPQSLPVTSAAVG